MKMYTYILFFNTQNVFIPEFIIKPAPVSKPKFEFSLLLKRNEIGHTDIKYSLLSPGCTIEDVMLYALLCSNRHNKDDPIDRAVIKSCDAYFKVKTLKGKKKETPMFSIAVMTNFKK